MQVKKFEAPTIQEALEVVKRELGPEAIILQTKHNKKGFGLLAGGSVEITAAVSDRALQKKKKVETRLPSNQRDQVQKMSAKNQAHLFDKYARRYDVSAEGQAAVDQLLGQRPVDRVEMAPKASATRKAAPAPATQKASAQAPSRPITKTRYADIDAHEVQIPVAAQAPKAVKPASMDEISELKRMVKELQSAQDGVVKQADLNPALQEVFNQLVLAGVEKRHAMPMIKKVLFDLGDDAARNSERVLDQIAMEILNTVAVVSPMKHLIGNQSGPRVVAWVGPTGVGKTTTLAKVASEAILKHGKRVGLINLDSYKVAAFDQLATYAKILNVPFRSAENADDLKAAIADFNGLDLVLIDTAGRSQKDPESLSQMKRLLEEVNAESQLVLSVTTRDAELYDMAQRFGIFAPTSLTFSKLDEANTFGSIYNVHQRTKLPLLYFTTGQRVPEDIEDATAERMVSCLLDL